MYFILPENKNRIPW